jgi:hypothetical protein
MLLFYLRAICSRYSYPAIVASYHTASFFNTGISNSTRVVIFTNGLLQYF